MFTVLAVVGARGGSKRIPGKNLRLVAGRPLIEWTLDVAKRAPAISRTILSTDDDDIAALGLSMGVEVPFRRPPELSGDEATSEAFVIHALDWLEAHENYRPDAVILLQPTSPLRAVSDVEGALALFQTRNAEFVCSVAPFHGSASWLRTIAGDGRLCRTAAGPDATPTYILNGAIYIARPEALRSRGRFDAGDMFAYVMPRERSLDIDEEWDHPSCEPDSEREIGMRRRS